MGQEVMSVGHDGEDDLIQRGRTMVELGLTRAKHALRQWFFFFSWGPDSCKHAYSTWRCFV